jgi:LmbE family N-acetylglucosaminyl deacetylase
MTPLGWGNTLVVVAHADDETLGAGGDSTSAQYPGDSEIHERRWSHFREAMQVLGVTDWAEFDGPDMALATIPGAELADWVTAQIRRVRADTVLTTFPGDANEDHRAIARAVGIAVRPRLGSSVRRLLWFETASSTEWGPLQGMAGFRPTVAVDISDTLDTKVRAFSRYLDELRPAPDPRSPDALQAMAVSRGSQWGSAAAEVFEPAMLRL